MHTIHFSEALAKRAGYFATAILAVLVLGGCAGQVSPSSPVQPDQVNVPAAGGAPGGQVVRDEHGCLTSAGDAWCEILQKCYRPGVEACELKDEHGCVTSSGSYWCDKQQKCYDSKTEFCDLTKNFCSDTQRKATSCGRLMTPVCAWMADDGKCQNSLCIVSFSSPCSACLNPAVKYYTPGFCPAQKLSEK